LLARKNINSKKLGLYIPGGTAPLFSTVLMLAVPATIAGSGHYLVLYQTKWKYQSCYFVHCTNLCSVTKIFSRRIQAVLVVEF
jgi:histidinol dehydrogenase